ncbi:DUF6691 family protein [Nannocystis bainbridge]|uniref:YeeE/YedE family protein n=1 Tax=Nannocystis bainbridge TaxID=2995303 RepID=A0ABT5EAF6_9BACT|nr:DUF6691 family protein [Nannocystis bainbridge]MDC0722841.1 YeeE/YedE family protein [Nannocystis bainbridge]
MTVLVALLSGLVFALGLGLAGMTRPENVLAFLDLAGAWDPALMLVLGGAAGLYMLAAPLVLRRGRPLLAPRFHLPQRSRVDRSLLAGAALFGLGWGLVGLCPGPALVGLAGGSGDLALFVAAMLAGMFLFTRVEAPSP